MKRSLALTLGCFFFAAAAPADAARGRCPAADDPAGALRAVHEQARKAHIGGNADLIEASTADTMLLASLGDLNVSTRKDVGAFFRGYFARVRYLEWSDMQPPAVTLSRDRRLGWMAVQIKARYVDKTKPEAGEKSFKSSWIAVYQRFGCEWKMTGISSAVVDL